MAPRLAGFPGCSSASLHRAALDQADRGRVGLGGRPGRSIAELCGHARSASGPRPRGPPATCRPVRLPDAPRPRHDDQCRRSRRAPPGRVTGARARRRRGRRPHAPARDPVLVNLLIRDFVRSLEAEGRSVTAIDRRPYGTAPSTTTTWTRALRPAASRAVHLVAHRPRPRPARRRPSPTSSGCSTRTSRSTGWPSARSRPCSRRAASGSIPLSAWLASANPRTSPPSRPDHDLNAFQAIRRMDEILVANFMVFHDAVEPRASTTSSSATRRGTSTTSSTRTRSSSGRPSPG